MFENKLIKRVKLIESEMTVELTLIVLVVASPRLLFHEFDKVLQLTYVVCVKALPFSRFIVAEDVVAV